jgi:hypothetical protein
MTARSSSYLYGRGRYYMGGHIECQYEIDYQFQQTEDDLFPLSSKITAKSQQAMYFAVIIWLSVGFFTIKSQMAVYLAVILLH